MGKKLGYGKLVGFLGLSAIAILGNCLTTLAQDDGSMENKPDLNTVERKPLEVRITPPAASGSGGSCYSTLSDRKTFEEALKESNMMLPIEQRLNNQEIEQLINEKLPLKSKRVELYYYRNAINMVNILNQLNLIEGCATVLPLNSFQAGQGVGRGGGNVISLYGTQDYIDSAQRFITSLDLPLPGIDLQLWGAQISSDDPNKLAQTTSKVRSRISETQRLLRETFASIQGISQETLKTENSKDEDKSRTLIADDSKEAFKSFIDAAKQLGYEDAIDGLGGESSILEVFLVGNTVKDPAKFYNGLYSSLTEPTIDKRTGKEKPPALEPYLEELRKDIDHPPFERIFRSRGLEPDCIQPHNYETLKQEGENEELKCQQWQWNKAFVPNTDIALVDITANYERKVLLEFALHYANFIENPEDFDSGELQRTADSLNELLQNGADLLQKDIEDLFLKPTLAMIQKEVAKDKEVEFAQVGRSTISTLDGVQTEVNSRSISGFQVPQSQDLGQLLARAQELQEQVGNFIPTETLPEASEASEIVTTGPLPASQAIALAVAALEQQSVPVEIETGTNLAFTPGISRNLNSAELNIKLEVVDPTVKPTSESKNVPPLSRIGKQEMNTTVYTQALDFFDLSTFTSQATLDGGRWRVPIIGDFWNAIFGPIPVFGDLFSVAKGNQNVLHESLILTNSFITPTPLSLGNLYAPLNSSSEFDFCQRRKKLLNYLDTLQPAGQASPRETRIIREQCKNNL